MAHPWAGLGARRGTPLLVAALLAWLPVRVRAADAPLNVVFVDICSARADHFGAYGYARPTTPEMDKLAKESVVFDRALAQSSWCLPNYASLFTGLTAEAHGQNTNIPFRGVPDFQTTLAQRFKDAGYDTAAFSGGIYLMQAWGLHKGFDVYENVFSTSEAKPASVSTTLSRAEHWVEGRQAPFFLYLAVDDLHAPYQSEEPERFDPGYEGVAHSSDVAHVGFFRAYNGEPLVSDHPLRARLREFRSEARHLDHLTAHYDAALSHVDRKIGQLVKRLKDTGRWDRTVFIVTGDHGELLGEHGLLGHTEGLYEPVLRVPLIAHHPGFKALAGRRISRPVQRIDLTPTLLEIAGVPYGEQELQGQSLIPLLINPSGPWRRYAYASSKRNMSAVADSAIDERVLQDERWKLHWYLYKGRYELYDLHNDPLETTDLSERHPEIVSRMAFELLKRVELSRPQAPGPKPEDALHRELPAQD